MDNFQKMWFGTRDYSTWIEAPLSGADSSPGAWGDGGVLLGGDAYQINSFNTHKKYVYSWPSSSSREEAQLMASFFSGTYGRGKIHFLDPLTYDINVLPAKWADPSITADYEGPSIIPGKQGTPVNSPYVGQFALPAKAMQYSFQNETLPGPGDPRWLTIPVPEGAGVYVSVAYSYTGNVRVRFANSAFSTEPGPALTLPPMNEIQTGVAGYAMVGFGSQQVRFVHLHVGSSDGLPLNGTITISGAIGRVVENAQSGAVPDWVHRPYRWVGGQGNAGVRFDAPPTYISQNGVDGGQVEYAASFTESVI